MNVSSSSSYSFHFTQVLSFSWWYYHPVKQFKTILTALNYQFQFILTKSFFGMFQDQIIKIFEPDLPHVYNFFLHNTINLNFMYVKLKYCLIFIRKITYVNKVKTIESYKLFLINSQINSRLKKHSFLMFIRLWISPSKFG